MHPGLIALCVMSGGVVIFVVRRSPAILGERSLAVLAAVTVLALWLVIADILFSSGIWSGAALTAVTAALAAIVPLVTAVLVLRRVSSWAVLGVDPLRALEAIEKALQGVRIEYHVSLPSVVLTTLDARLTVRRIAGWVLWITFGGNVAAPKIRLFKKVAHKFLLFGPPA